MVSEQLGLAKGFGLVVDYVVPDSPAATAGLQQNDILKMLNDQILIDPNQLRKLLQTFQDGTTVTLTILRKGQEQKVTAKLTKKEMPIYRQSNKWCGPSPQNCGFLRARRRSSSRKARCRSAPASGSAA